MWAVGQSKLPHPKLLPEEAGTESSGFVFNWRILRPSRRNMFLFFTRVGMGIGLGFKSSDYLEGN